MQELNVFSVHDRTPIATQLLGVDALIISQLIISQSSETEHAILDAILNFSKCFRVTKILKEDNQNIGFSYWNVEMMFGFERAFGKSD